MKIIILILSISLCLAQNPIPLPNLNLTAASGLWYVVWGFAGNETLPQNISCMTWDINLSENEIDINFEYLSAEYSEQQTFSVVNPGNSVWNVGLSDNYYEWLVVDVLNHNWAVIGLQSTQKAFVLSRNQNISNTVLQAQILLLEGEGYTINSTNQYIMSNVNCNN